MTRDLNSILDRLGRDLQRLEFIVEIAENTEPSFPEEAAREDIGNALLENFEFVHQMLNELKQTVQQFPDAFATPVLRGYRSENDEAMARGAHLNLGPELAS